MISQEWPATTIREQSKRCLEQFAKTMGAFDFHYKHGNMAKHELVEERNRFKIWAANIGVFSEIQESLDFRLREIFDVKDLFAEQLETIQTRLEQVALSDEQRGFQDASRDGPGGISPSEKKFSFEEWNIDEIFHSIHESIDWLHRLSNMVRKATFTNANRKAQDFQLRDAHGRKSEQLTQDLTKGLSELYRFYIQRDASDLEEWLVTRLVETMIIRHKRILYRRSKRRVWDLRETEYNPSTAPSANESGLATPGGPIIMPDAKALDVSILPSLPVSTPAPSQSRATTVDIKTIRRDVRRSTVSTASTAFLSKSEQELVPPCPKILENSVELVCDYCGLLLQGHQISDEGAWLKHVQKDLDAYICVYDDCDEALHLYASRKEWLLHMRNRHRTRWHCFGTSHLPVYFDTPDDLESHMRSDHSDHLSEEHLTLLIQSSAHPINPTIESCPFCTEAQEMDKLEEHVAWHLRVFALLSMPWPDNISSDAKDTDSDAQRISSLAGTRETIREEQHMLPSLDRFDSDDRPKSSGSGIQPTTFDLVYSKPEGRGREKVVDFTHFMTNVNDLRQDHVLEHFKRGKASDGLEEPRRRSRSSSTSNRFISDRGESQFEQSHPFEDFPLIKPPRSGKKLDLQAALYAEQVLMEGGKKDLYKCFYPRGSLDQLITPQIVFESIFELVENGAVRSMDADQIKQYADKICGTSGPNPEAKSFKKMFAILLLTDAPALIIDFVDEDLSDSDLPLNIDSPLGHNSFQRSLHRKFGPDKPIQCLEKWSIPGRTSFYSYQWTTIAPFFAKAARAKRINIYKLSDEDILPWTKKFSVREYGGYSEVYRVMIHKNHHNFGNRKHNDGTFAVKKLRYEEVDTNQSRPSAAPSSAEGTRTGTFEERARQQFLVEVQALERFSDDAHPHLISLLTAFQKGRSCYLLFDWAHSDLLHFWKNTMPGSPLEEQNVKWLINQICGIVDGLYHIHTYRLSNNSALEPTSGLIYGRHGDIKPQNFLIFKKGDQLFQESVIKLTDFGLTRFHSETSRSGIRQSKIAGFTPSYRPPELDLEGATISRSFDIWSLGCVFLEFITWHFGGWSYLHNYVLNRMRKDIISGHKTDQFFEFVQNERTEEYGLRIKLEVLQWISDLHMRPDCSNLIHDVLDFIETKMLAVIPPSDNTDQPRTRARIEEVLEKFTSFKDKSSWADYSLEGYSKATLIDVSAISVNMTLEPSKREELRKGLFDIRRGDLEYTTRRVQTDL